MRADVLDLPLRRRARDGGRRHRRRDLRAAAAGRPARRASATWHGRPDLAAAAATAAATRIGELRDSVRVLDPAQPVLAGRPRDAPLLLTVANGLPVTMEVRLSISSTTGLRVAPIPPQRIPPLGRRQVQVSAEVVRSGQFSVEATVHSPAGRALGPPSRLQVRSTAYGTITVWLTGSAAVLLVVLARTGWCAGSGASRARATGPGPRSAPPTPEPAGRPGPDRTPRAPGPRTARSRPGHRRRSTDGPADGTGPRRRTRNPPTTPVPARRPTRSPRPVRYRPAARDARRPVARRRGPSLGRASSLMAVASLVSRVTGFLRQLALVSRARPGRGQRLLHGREHAAQHRLRAAARRRADQRDGAAAGPRADRGRRRRRGLHPAPAHRGRRGARPRDPRGDG